jgi:hypothetical protein
MTNAQVITAWTSGVFAENKNLSSDGILLRHRDVVVAEQREEIARIIEQEWFTLTARYAKAAETACFAKGFSVILVKSI